MIVLSAIVRRYAKHWSVSPLPRPFHSSSTLSLGAGCEYAWALSELQGLREPEIAWADIATGKLKPKFDANPWRGECTFKQRGAAYGKCGHATLETWYKGGAPNWHSLPGQAAAHALHLYPRPEACGVIEVETEIGDEPSGLSYVPGTPWEYGQHDFIMTAHGVHFAGTRDLLVKIGAEEEARLGVPGLPGGWLLLDHKFRASLEKYGDTPDKLRAGVQSCLYSLDVMRKTRQDTCVGRWVNMENKDVRREAPVDFAVTRDEALDVLATQIPLARRLDSIQTLAQAERNLETCFKFSGRPGAIGCNYHISKGGPCDAHHTASMLIQARRKDNKSMGIDPALAAKFKAKKMGAIVPATTAPGETTEAPAEITGSTDTSPPAPKPRAPRTPSAPKVAEVAPAMPATPAVERAAAVVAMQAELAAVQEALELAEGVMKEAQSAYHEADSRVCSLRAEAEGVLARIVEACR